MKQRTKDARGTKRKREVEELQLLEKRVAAFDGDGGGAKKFADLPLSQQTLAGLEKSFFTNLTDIQARALPVALKGRERHSPSSSRSSRPSSGRSGRTWMGLGR